MATEIRGKLDGGQARVAVVVAQFNALITERLLTGALEHLEARAVASVQVIRVPGAFELPLACRWLANSGNFDAIIALGVVIRGETSHYDFVCDQASRGILDASLASGVPIGFGLLTCETNEQALERAGGKVGNKGAEAAAAALEMLGLKNAIDG